MSEGDETQKALVLAQGKALAILATMLERDRPFRAEEYGQYLGTFAAVTGDLDHKEALILANWSDVVTSLARMIAKPPE